MLSWLHNDRHFWQQTLFNMSNISGSPGEPRTQSSCLLSANIVFRVSLAIHVYHLNSGMIVYNYILLVDFVLYHLVDAHYPVSDCIIVMTCRYSYSYGDIPH